MSRHYLADYAAFPMPRLRTDAYYGAFMNMARVELEKARYAFDTRDGREFEAGRCVSQYCNPADYASERYATREQVYNCVFSRAIKARAARLFNRAHA